ncbi:MAG: nucleotidyltransferase domain-containing protein [Nanoarchaeota archaeon]
MINQKKRKEKESCKNAERIVADHFPDVGKMVEIGSSAKREIKGFTGKLAKDLYITNSDNIITEGDNMKIELKIVDLLARNPDKRFTINEISKFTEEYYSFVHRTVSRLTKDEVITKARAGKAYLCSLNLDNEKTLTLIQLSELEKKSELYTKNKELKLILEDFIQSVKTNLNTLSVVLFGSYSKGTATKESDIDIMLIGKNNMSTEKIAKEIYAKYGKELNPIIMTPGDFKKQKDKTIIKEVISNHHILYGVEDFVRQVFRK